MKRGASQALVLLVDEIVEEGKAKDANGELVWPIVQEAMIAGFFGAPEALLDALRNRPLLILALIQTNKRLEAFWNHFEGLWIALIDDAIAREALKESRYSLYHNNSRGYIAETYPFYAVTNHRILQSQKALVPKCYLPESPKLEMTTFLLDTMPYYRLIRPGEAIGSTYYMERQYALIYYEPLTKLFIELLQRIKYMHLFFDQPVDPDTMLDAYISTLTGKPVNEPFINRAEFKCLADAFLVKKDNFNPPAQDVNGINLFMQDIISNYAPYRHGPLVSAQVEITIEVERRRETVGFYYLAVVKAFYEITRLISRIEGMLRRHYEGTAPIMPEKVQTVVLDKNTTKPFRDLLYDKEQGLYNTKEKQKAFYIAILGSVRETFTSKEAMINRYGEAYTPLRCVTCLGETYNVDPVLKRAFCTQECRKMFI